MTTDITLARPPRPPALPWLGYGAIAALLAGGLSAASSSLEFAWGEGKGFTLSAGLLLASAAPLIVVLVAFLSLADATHEGPLVNLKDERKPNPLRKSSICTFGVSLLLIAVGALAGPFPDPSRAALFGGAVAVGLVLAALAGFALGGGGFTVLVAFYLITRFLGGPLLAQHGMDRDLAVIIASFLLLVVSAVAYPIWFAVVLLRMRPKLGPWATVLGWATILCLAVMLGLSLVGIAAAVSAPETAAADDQEADAVFAPHLWRINLAALISEVTCAVATALLLLDARRRLTEAER
jgi:hypothetical protein